MFNKNKKKEKQYRKIVLQDTKNKNIFIAIGIAIVILITFGLSKMYLPDGRINKTNYFDEKVNFANRELVIDAYSINFSENLGEFHITDTIISDDEKYNLTFQVLNENDEELPINVISGAILDEEQSFTKRQYHIVQFGVSDDFYYVTLKITQKDIRDDSFLFDYRSLNERPILEKGKNYLLETEETKFLYQTFSTDHLVQEKELIESQLTQLNNTIKNENDETRITNLQKEVATKEEELEAKKAEIKLKEKEFKNIEKAYQKWLNQ